MTNRLNIYCRLLLSIAGSMVLVASAGDSAIAGDTMRGNGSSSATGSAATDRQTNESRSALYYQDPDGKPLYSPTPTKTNNGRDFVPVYEDASGPTSSMKAVPSPQSTASSTGKGRILYYRNPMGADTSPVPKKDAMGMDYVPVYADEASPGGGTIRISTEKIQRAGVRTGAVKRLTLTRTVRAAGTPYSRPTSALEYPLSTWTREARRRHARSSDFKRAAPSRPARPARWRGVMPARRRYSSGAGEWNV